MRIAILSLQGAFIEHSQMLREIGVDSFEIRQFSDWQQPKDGLILPGGESTVQMHLLKSRGLYEPIRTDIRSGLPVFGTCAGMILLSEGYLDVMSIRVRRNAYGRQLGSFHVEGKMNGVGENLPFTFIRAPYVDEILSNDCEVLSQVNGRIVAVSQGSMLATAFHPELDHDFRIHQHFIQMCTS